jgi:hypothetical protein
MSPIDSARQVMIKCYCDDGAGLWDLASEIPLTRGLWDCTLVLGSFLWVRKR